MFTTVQDGINWIESVKRFGDKLDLSRMELACEILGHPERDLPVIHIAGTNGKGSTVSYLKHILLEQGYNVGTYTSPYIVRFNERITYNYNDITNEELLYYINKVHSLHQDVFETHHQVITFFELVTLISFLYFHDRDIDFCIYEVGLGGTLDATNVVHPMICAITSISYDHMGVLGNTLEEIALNKLGIVKEHVPLVTTVSDEGLISLFTSVTNKHHSELIQVNQKDITEIHYGQVTSFRYKDQPYKISMLGVHQVFNASLSIEILLQLEKRQLVRIENYNLQAGLLKTYWPGRMEIFGNIILDGAHNIGGTTVLKESMDILYKDKYIKVLYTSMADKEYFDNIQVIETFADEIYFTEIDYHRCETAENLFNVSNHPHKYLRKDPLAALQELKQLKKNEVLLITGSLYFISYIRKEL